MIENKTIGVVIIVLLVAVLIVSIVGVQQRSVTGAVASGATGGMSTGGFSSYDEMMKAHHGGSSASQQSSSSAGCGGVPQQTDMNSGVAVTNGEKTKYGLTYDNAGYEKLVEAAKTIQLTQEQTQKIVGLDAQIPCCGFKDLQASGNCECGHHQALYGLAKILASKDYSRSEIQSEMNKWKTIFYPNSGGSSNTGACG